MTDHIDREWLKDRVYRHLLYTVRLANVGIDDWIETLAIDLEERLCVKPPLFIGTEDETA